MLGEVGGESWSLAWGSHEVGPAGLGLGPHRDWEGRGWGACGLG